SAVSRTDSPRESWSSAGRITTAWPPSSTTPASKERRVRVEGFSKMRPTTRSRSAWEDHGPDLSSTARSRRRFSSSLVSSAPVRKCRVKRKSVAHGPHNRQDAGCREADFPGTAGRGGAGGRVRVHLLGWKLPGGCQRRAPGSAAVSGAGGHGVHPQSDLRPPDGDRP